MILALLATCLIAGDPRAGRSIFEGKGKCLSCHSIGQRGGSVGPDLGAVSLARTEESLRLALIDPGAEIFPEYLTTVIDAGGGAVEGITLNEDDLSIQIRDAAGNPRSFHKSQIKRIHREERSLMPSFRQSLSRAEIDDVLAYLRTLRGDWKPPGAPRRREIAKATESIAWLDRPERDGEERPDTLIEALRLTRTDIVADIGAGTGYYTWRLARHAGRVWAIDIQPSMLDRIGAAARKRGATNITTSGALPSAPLDLAFVGNSYHEFAEPEAMLAAIHKALKPGGRLIVVEYAKEARFAGVSDLHRMSLEELRSEIEPAGFDLERILDFLPIQHGMIFRRR